MSQFARLLSPGDSASTGSPERIELGIKPDEAWWGGSVADGTMMPYGRSSFSRDLASADSPDCAHPGIPSSQSSPLLLSTSGRIVWSERPFSFQFRDGQLTVVGHDIQVLSHGDCLRDAFMEASHRFFPPSGHAPAKRLFAGAQYNTWIDQPYRPTQITVLDYVCELLGSHMPPGVVFIDDSWSPSYGTWRFDPARFPSPDEMVRQLHDWGCSVMVWVVPFVSPDTDTFRQLERHGLLLRDCDGNTVVRRWWNGISAILDLSNPATISWFTCQLDDLMRDTGVDGFKFDGGDVRDYRTDDMTARPAEPVDMCEAWAGIGLRYPYNEYRACWRMGGRPLAQRLRDKPASWDDLGIGSLIPEMLAQGMIGHPFTCPDMIGGGEISSAQTPSNTDQEFFVRYSQIAAFSPIAQFSVSPTRVLDNRHLAAVRKALQLRDELQPTLLSLVDNAAITGEPIVRPMAFHAPDLNTVTDQYFFGPDMIVAPVLTPSATSRTVLLPDGAWRSPSGDVINGPATVSVECDLETIPRFVRNHDR